MKPGDVLWVRFPGRAGHAQAGRRPAVQIQGAEATERLPTVLVIPLTTQIDALRFPGTILIEPDALNQLPRPSVALVFQLSALDKQFFDMQLGSVSKSVLDELWTALENLSERPGL